MPYRDNTNDQWDDETEVDDFEADVDDDDDDTIPCPYCREFILEDAPRCPHCGNYISEEDHPPTPRPWWIVATVILCLVLIYFWIAGR